MQESHWHRRIFLAPAVERLRKAVKGCREPGRRHYATNGRPVVGGALMNASQKLGLRCVRSSMVCETSGPAWRLRQHMTG